MRTRRAVMVASLTQLILVSLVLPASAMEPLRAHKRDAMITHPELDALRPAAIALLPAVAFVDDPPTMSYVETFVFELYAATGHEWRPASLAHDRMSGVAGRSGSLREDVAREVRRTGHVEPATAGELARLLGVESTMSVRIDRWEVVSGRAMVEMTAALVDSSGRVLWQISGLSGYGDATTPWTTQDEGRRLSKATYNLLARWSAAIPGPADRNQTDPSDRPVASR